MRKFSNFVKLLAIITISNVNAQEIPAWVKNPQNATEEFMAKMLSSDAGDKNWVYCYRCAFARTDIDSKVNEENCLKVYKIWNSKELDEVRKSCH